MSIEKFVNAINAYSQGNPFMTDSEFDELERSLQRQGIDTLAIRLESFRKDASRKFPMTTLGKLSLEDALVFMSKYPTRIEPKYDGVAVGIVTLNGNVVSAFGRSGTDFTKTVVKAIGEDALVKDTLLDGTFYGEMVIAKSEQLPKKYKNRRNAVAGILNANDPDQDDIDMLSFIPYAKVTNSGVEPIGFAYPFVIENTEDFLNSAKTFFDETVDAELDGIVIKAADQADREHLGFDGTYSWQFAYKFEDEEFETVLESIDWQVSSNGKVTPVANFTPVEDELGTISRATVASLQKLEDLDLAIGCKLTIKRANKVIPYIVSSDGTGTKIQVPDILEGKRTYRVGAHLFVDARMYDDPLATIRHQISLLGAKNITANKIQKAIDSGAIDIFDFYEYLDAQGDTFTKDKLQSIFDDRSPGEWLMFLNISGIGRGKIKVIDSKYQSLSVLATNYKNRSRAKNHPALQNMHTFSPSIESALLKNYDIIGDFAEKVEKFRSEHGTVSI